MYTRCESRVLCCRTNVIHNMMTIKLVIDGYSTDHAEGHEGTIWNLPLLHNKRNVYGPNIELDKDDILCLVFNIDMRAKG